MRTTNSIRLTINRFYSSKNKHKTFLKDTEILKIGKDRPKDNFLSVFGVSSTGALGIKHFISGKRVGGNILHAIQAYPLYFFNSFSNQSRISVKDVSAGYGFTLFSGKSTKHGWKVYGCGINNYSQLGFQEQVTERNGFQIIMEPAFVNLPSQLQKINHIGCGRAHSVIVGDLDSSLLDSQVVYLLGNNQFGQCAREIIENEIYSKSSLITTVNFPKRIKQVECGESTTFLLAEDGSVYGCGSNNYGQLGNNLKSSCSSFTQVTGGLENKIVKQISSRCNTVLALTTDGEVWAWGNNEYGTIFNDAENSYVCNPVRLIMPDTVKNVIQVSSGNTIAALLDGEGQVHTWGMFCLGMGPNVKCAKFPELIPPGLFGGGLKAFNTNASKVVSVVCGVKYNAALTSAGSLYVWGDDCVKKRTTQTFPSRMYLTINAHRVFMGADHTIVMGGHVA